MMAASLGACLMASVTVASGARTEVLCGMVAPLAMAVGSWVLAARTFRARPQALTGLMIGAFGVKLVFFGAYVAVVIVVLSFELPPGVLPIQASLPDDELTIFVLPVTLIVMSPLAPEPSNTPLPICALSPGLFSL